MRDRILMIALLWAVAVAAVPASAATGNHEEWTWSATAGLGYDSNVYLTPKASYIDLSQPGNPLIVPKIQSGFFVPLGLGAEYTEPSGMEFKYLFNGQIYVGKALGNANTFDHDVTWGLNSTLDNTYGDWLQGAQFYAGLLAGYHKKVYYDRDTGEAKLSRTSKTNISNRYTHFDVGGEAKLQQDVGDVEYKLNTKLAKLLYNDPIVISSLDHLLFELGGNGRMPLGSKSTKLKVGYDFVMRSYDTRPAFNLQGVQTAANGTLTYYYNTANVQLFHKFDKSFMVFLDYWHTWRIDGALGYNSYSKDRVKGRFRYHPGGDFLLRGSVAYSRTKYPHAFAFNNPVAAQKKYNRFIAMLKGEYEGLFAGKYGDPNFWLEGTYDKQNSSDLRYVYNRAQIMIGGDWKF